MTTFKSLPLGIKIIIFFFLLSVILWTFGQGGAVVAYDTVASWGFQDLRENLDPALVEMNKGIGLSDFIIQIPLFIIAIIGLWKKKMWGAVTSWIVLGINIYWPIVAFANQCFFTQGGIKHQAMDIGVIVLLCAIVIFSKWSCWYLFKHREVFT